MDNTALRLTLSRLASTGGVAPTGESNGDWRALGDHVRAVARLQLRATSVTSLMPEDIAQEILVRLNEAALLQRLSDEKNPGGFVFAMVRNRIRDELRRNAGRGRAELAYAVEQDRDAGDEEKPWDERLRRALREAIADLSEEHWALLRAVYDENQDGRARYREIGEQLGLSPSNVAVRHFRIIRALRRRIEGDLGGVP